MPGLASKPDAQNSLRDKMARFERSSAGAATDARAELVATPRNIGNFSQQAELLRRQRHLAQALAVCATGLDLHPQDLDLLFIHGNILRDSLRHVEALNAYGRLLALKPDHADAIHEMGVVLVSLGHPDRAIEAFCTVLTLKPDHSSALRNLGQILTIADRLDEAVNIFRLALQGDPDNHFLRLRKAYQQMHICDWSEFGEIDALLDKPDALCDAGTPFVMLAFADDPVVQLRHASALSRKLCKEAATMAPATVRQTAPGSKIRIGYLSSDFHDHATMFLMAGLFREHDRSAFEINALSHGPDCPDHAMRRLLVDCADTFTDLRNLSDGDAANRIRAMDLDILIDLKGYTKDARNGILACRPAPLQVGFVGYPGSMGADFIDYLVADAIVVPAGERRHYTESIISLPGSYQPTNDRRLIAPATPTRRELGLPDEAFIFCCFNQTYKITPVEFDLWMRLLAKTDGSVLWLLACNPWAEANLRTEAERRGIDPDRLVFAGKLPQPEHLARISQADLFLDTFRVNAHTTMSDALWAGLPAVTLAGRQFAARVGASILAAAGLSELITATSAEYEELCLQLAHDRDRLASIRSSLKENRTTCPLFDTKAYTAAYEAGLRQAFERARSGLAPTDICIGQAHSRDLGSNA